MSRNARRLYPAALGLAVSVWLAALAAQQGPPGAFYRTGQAADLLLSGYGFGRSGGPLRFNHPGGIAIVGGRLVLADRNNNRVLVWDGVPIVGDEPPAFALGQPSLSDNYTGDGLDGLNWPTAVATDGVRLFVADTYNDRVLVWRTPPSRMQQPADYAITSGVRWPWGIWTDGRRLIVSSTGSGQVLVWNRLPEVDAPADMPLKIPEFGTPRAVVSDGTRLAVSDHNAKVNGTDGPGNFFWRQLPLTAQQPYSFFIATPAAPSTPVPTPPPGITSPVAPGEHFHQMLFVDDGRFLALGNQSLCVYAGFPSDSTTACSVLVGNDGRQGAAGFAMNAGDTSGMTMAGSRLFVSMNNGNRVVVFGGIPRSPDEQPAFAIGSPAVAVNTLATDAIVTNAVPLTDGTRLWVSSDFDRTLHVWRTLPTRDGQKPDYTYPLGFAPWASTRVGAGVALAGGDTVAIWRQPPDGQPADVTLTRQIGSAALSDLRGVAWDGSYFYLASRTLGRVWVWNGLPTATSEPLASLPVDQPGRISSDGRTLVVPSLVAGAVVLVYDVGTLSNGSAPQRLGSGAGGVRFNLPEHALVQDGVLFVADTPNNRVLAWRDIRSALAGAPPTAVLGAPDLNVLRPAIAADRLFWPGAVAWDGTNLWVGEFKFSNRIVRFRPPAAPGP